MDLTRAEVDAWERWFREVPVETKRDLGWPVGCYALTDMANKYLDLQRDAAEGSRKE